MEINQVAKQWNGVTSVVKANKRISQGLENLRTKNKTRKSEQPLKILTAKIGVQEGWRRVTVLLRDDHFEKLKSLSYWDRVPIKDILDEVLEKFLSSRKIRPAPKERRGVLPELEDAKVDT